MFKDILSRDKEDLILNGLDIRREEYDKINNIIKLNKNKNIENISIEMNNNKNIKLNKQEKEILLKIINYSYDLKELDISCIIY